MESSLITSPSTYLLDKSMPRLRGDGMDVTNQTSGVSSSPVGENKNYMKLRAASTETLITKSSQARHVAKEPVKGAVKHLQPKVLFTNTEQNTKTAAGKSPKSKSVDQINISNTNNDFTESKVGTDVAALLNVSGVESLTRECQIEPFEEREVEGEFDPDVGDNTQSQQRIAKLQEELNVQAKVNADLKKLLVASLGDDLQLKIESLSHCKNQLATEMGEYTDRILKDGESIDKLAIQADMWRSKYLAATLLCEELDGTQRMCVSYVSQSREALKRLLLETKQLREDAATVYEQLLELRNAFDPLAARSVPANGPASVLDLARLNTQLVAAVRSRLIGAVPLPTSSAVSDVTAGSTPGEMLACKVLNSDLQNIVLRIQNLKQHPHSMIDRWHPQTRFENITFNCCSCCKGDILVV